jgi:riboflavin synthase
VFTGLIEGTGHVETVRSDPQSGGILRVGRLPWNEINTIGESIAVNGACLTVVSAAAGYFEAELSPETLSRTNLSQLSHGARVNLERPLRIGDRLGGHLVLGHVDGLGKLLRFVSKGSFWEVEVQIPGNLARYVVEKGSIAVDGISLTIACLTGNSFTVAVIPQTWETTHLHTRKPGDPVNLETDIIAKHLEQLMKPYTPESPITPGFLTEHGFL